MSECIWSVDHWFCYQPLALHLSWCTLNHDCAWNTAFLTLVQMHEINLLISGECLQMQAHQEPQQGPEKHFRWAPKHFHGALPGRKFLKFFFPKWHILMYFCISEWQRKPQTLRGSGQHTPTPQSWHACTTAVNFRNILKHRYIILTNIRIIGHFDFYMAKWWWPVFCCISAHYKFV